ncbi:type II toxin-antitoxin system death-on-curing family toxin [Algihabitans albus]|uniref:type II toxin-antitoxin system death-on-curing family toxin n=1 Tax=Algihabitans albus TaxID=2164067 RepID=UPI000E5D681B|nr:type II toxin-antitoxin system death-on-curing family toxin [Algihabitans albus]
MKEPYWLKMDEALAIHHELIDAFGGLHGVRDQVLLEAALARPQQIFVYTEETSLFALAAAYMAAVVRNDPFVDGNKRAGFAFGLVFLDRKGIWVEGDTGEATKLIYNLAAGQPSETDLIDWLNRNAVSAATVSGAALSAAGDASR